MKPPLFSSLRRVEFFSICWVLACGTVMAQLRIWAKTGSQNGYTAIFPGCDNRTATTEVTRYTNEILNMVAIIGVLVAISIPIFSSQLEKARDAVTLSNVRAAYAEAQSAYLTQSDEGTTVKYTAGTNGGATVTVSGVEERSSDSWHPEPLPIASGRCFIRI